MNYKRKIARHQKQELKASYAARQINKQKFGNARQSYRGNPTRSKKPWHSALFHKKHDKSDQNHRAHFKLREIDRMREPYGIQHRDHFGRW